MFSSLRKGLAVASLAAASLIGFGTSAHADLFDSYLTPNTLNSFEDNSREAFFDVDNSGDFSVGDVLVGFVRIENKTSPDAFSLGNTTYAIFSQQVADITASLVTFAPTTADGLTLADLGVTGAEANSMIALYTGNYATDIIVNSPGDLTTNGTVTLADYLAFITAGGDLELTAGIDASEDDFFAALMNFVAPPTIDQIATSDTNDAIAIFGAALSILTNNTNFLFADDVCTNFFGIAGCSDLTLVTGTVQGASNAANGFFRDGSELTNSVDVAYQQCDTTGGCGFIDNVDINVHPVPEPGSMILFGLGLAALGMYGRRARNRAKSE